ncbi:MULTISPECIES: hypothetical protein [Amycolatopsis]|uniref:Uncharacterized protein n=2 Tax=Amycolatopsis TaxID=1813 RepID=A0A229S4A5_9PSEU|nr:MULTISPECIES: hypothetical protein [Amycolatopsis]AXB41309.1 hypothetical protein A4R43_01230 [Amycolatopsis albispora]OXM53782.1 hypothetical protein CFP71_21460 [Amycolatopsis thailandensis]
MPQPPGSGTLADQIRALANRLDELARAKPNLPACVVRLTGDANLAAGADTFAQLGWSATHDPLAQFVTGAAGVPAYIQIARAGYYRVHFHSAVTGANAVAAAKVSTSGSNVGNSIATDAAPIVQAGSDGAVLDALRSRIYLNSGDKLYWSNWCNAAATVKGSLFGVPTEISVQYVSAQ